VDRFQYIPSTVPLSAVYSIFELEEKYYALFDFANTKNHAKLSEIIDFILADVFSGNIPCT
jgi:hypothetical protein